MLRKIAIAVAVLLAGSVQAHAQTTPTRTIGLGDPSRAQLLDALRTAIARDLGQPVKFMVEQMHVHAGWAFVVAHPRTPAGAAIDFGKTRYAARRREGPLDGDTLYALLQQRDGKWVVVTFLIGPADAGWMGWQDEYHTPAGLIPQAGSGAR